MKILTSLHWLFTHVVWNPMPRVFQKGISHLWGITFSQPFSSFIIPIMCRMYQMDEEYLSQFRPPQNKKDYQSFQDFFTREMVYPKRDLKEPVWPCEGYVYRFELMKEAKSTKVKGEVCAVNEIFGVEKARIPQNYQFINIFLHNHNYHRLHSPVDGKVVSIQRIPGKLVFLRPWLYREKSLNVPAMVNERVNVEIRDELGRDWFISFIGGMGVGTISLFKNFKLGSWVRAGEELGLFLLGSSCCLAIPLEIVVSKKNQAIFACEKIIHKDLMAEETKKISCTEPIAQGLN